MNKTLTAIFAVSALLLSVAASIAQNRSSNNSVDSRPGTSAPDSMTGKKPMNSNGTVSTTTEENTTANMKDAGSAPSVDANSNMNSEKTASTTYQHKMKTKHQMMNRKRFNNEQSPRVQSPYDTDVNGQKGTDMNDIETESSSGNK